MRTVENDELTEKIIGAAIEVHRALGPGLLESAFEECVSHEMRFANLNFARQQPLPVVYKSVHLDCGYRIDLVVEGRVVVELKTVDRLLPIHDAQLLTYLRLAGIRTGLILNFNVPALREGIKRMVL
jgi:GxxExxY protein